MLSQFATPRAHNLRKGDLESAPRGQVTLQKKIFMHSGAAPAAANQKHKLRERGSPASNSKERREHQHFHPSGSSQMTDRVL